jgi:hypothetical protein
MIYVFDTNAFLVIGHYFPERFPSFWRGFDEFAAAGKIISVREVFKELEGHGNRPHLLDWISSHKNIFVTPTRDETEFVGEIFKIPHFQQMVSEKERLQGKPVADPFVISAAKVRKRMCGYRGSNEA